MHPNLAVARRLKLDALRDFGTAGRPSYSFNFTHDREWHANKHDIRSCAMIYFCGKETLRFALVSMPRPLLHRTEFLAARGIGAARNNQQSTDELFFSLDCIEKGSLQRSQSQGCPPTSKLWRTVADLFKN